MDNISAAVTINQHAVNELNLRSVEFSLKETALYTVLSMLVFTCVNVMLTFILPELFHELYAQSNFWRFKNTFVSWSHSIISTLFVIVNIITTPQVFDDMINVSTKLSYITICVSTGYFIYDALDIVISNKKLSPQSWEVLAHHFVIIGIFWVPLVTNKFVGYTLAALSIEFNTVFLHLRFMLVFNGVDKSSIKFRIVSILNLVTFVMFRILTLCWMTRWIVLNRHLVHVGWFSLGSFGLAAMMVINILLLQRLLQSDFRNHSKQASSTSNGHHFVKETHHNTDAVKMGGNLHTE